MKDCMRIGLAVPTLNAGAGWHDFLDGLARQTLQPDRKLIIDSGSDDTTVVRAKQAGFDAIEISASEFDHGKVRQMAVALLSDCDIILLATQDIQFAEKTSIESLMKSFKSPDVVAAYGRQVAFPDASPSERHARAFNYPDQSSEKALADRSRLGIKTAFISNTFAAYRRQALLDVGGFPQCLIFGEDMYVGGKLLQNGGKIAYCADALVFHSHNDSLWRLMRRSFDIGVFHRKEAWLLETFATPEKEGWRLLRSEIRLFWEDCRSLFWVPIVRNGARFLAYRLGRLHHVLPLWLNRFFSLNRSYW